MILIVNVFVCTKLGEKLSVLLSSHLFVFPVRVALYMGSGGNDMSDY